MPLCRWLSEIPRAQRYSSQHCWYRSLSSVTLQWQPFSRRVQRISACRGIHDIRAARSHKQEAERDFFLTVLGASATKRDAKAYLSRFKPDSSSGRTAAQRRLALIKIRGLDDLQDDIVNGLCQTISQITRLGLHCVVVLDSDGDVALPSHLERSVGSNARAQAERLASGLESQPSIRAASLDEVFEITSGNPQQSERLTSSVQITGSVEVQNPKILTRLLERGIIPVISSRATAITTSRTQTTIIPGDDAVLPLTRHFAGLDSHAATPSSETNDSQGDQPRLGNTTDYVLDRMIVLDPVGALPSLGHPSGGHVFVNLEQEYGVIREELMHAHNENMTLELSRTNLKTAKTSHPIPHSHLTVSLGHEADGSMSGERRESALAPNRHIKNLDLLRNVLFLLPPSASAFLTSPTAAATLPQAQEGGEGLGVGTRRPKNPLIFNLLTDKPLNSSSLPASRLSRLDQTQPHQPTNSNIATFAKRGMHLTIIPDPRQHVWVAPNLNEKHISLQDPDIDFPRLLNLIEDSFNRPLDVKDYLERIRNRLAGIIVAGEYEGGAILTWELPPDITDDGSEATRQRMVPYLDKFAVLKRSQGAGGVADIVFSAMVRSCFPDGVCWRSRKDNPVNKWYFERAAGTWKIPDTNWTMFWTDADLALDGQRFLDYETVCRTVRPSWADNKTVVD